MGDKSRVETNFFKTLIKSSILFFVKQGGSAHGLSVKLDELGVFFCWAFDYRLDCCARKPVK